jgi:hypothetical protein
VKNQYFGDNKDLWKYDLVLMIMKAGLVSHFTFVPMLTEPDGTGHGNSADRSRASAGSDNAELVGFLDECLREGKKDINEIDAFFRQHGFSMTIYNGGSRYFTHQDRRQYFTGIGDELLSKSLILVDPDNGLEVKRPGEKHILYDEIKDLYDRMDGGSILMVYQYFPRVPRQQYLNTRMEELREKVYGDYPVCISDSEIAFFFLTKDESLEHALIHLVADYAGRYSN